MRSILASLAFLSGGLVHAAEPEQSVVVGVPKAQEFIATMNCEPDVCMDSFYRWSLVVDRQVSGPRTPRRVKAVRVQHGQDVFAERNPRLLFVLKPIESAEARARYGAEYFVEAMGRPTQVFCLSGRNQRPDLSTLEPAGELRGNKCYAEPSR